MQRMMTDSLEVEEVLFVTALHLSRQIAAVRGRPQTPYMHGFDFAAEQAYSRSFARDYTAGSADERSLTVSAQASYFTDALYSLRDSPLDIRHDGNPSSSAITPGELNGHGA